MQKITIGELAKRVNLRTSAIRYYEENGLIAAAERNESGYRLYGLEVEEELRLLQRAQQLGFSLSDIRILLQGWREGNLDHQSFLETAENRYLALEAEVTALLTVQHELGMFLQDVYQSSSQKTPASLLAQLIDHICINPLNRPAAIVFDHLLERTGCGLTSQAAKDLMTALSGEHIHIWNEGDTYSILIVNSDPKISRVLERFTEIALDCRSPNHAHIVPEWMHDKEGYLLTVEGEHAFIIARLFLEGSKQSFSTS